jgi:hypothetical protein
MLKKINALFIVFFFGIAILMGQDNGAIAFYSDGEKSSSGNTKTMIFEFKATPVDLSTSDLSTEVIGTHQFGDEIAKKMYLLNKKYTYQVAVVPGNPQTKTMINKPVIYDAVQKIERHLKKSYKKGEITIDSAENDLNIVLDVAYNVLTADTKNFEATIIKTSTAGSLIKLFTHQVKLVY